MSIMKIKLIENNLEQIINKSVKKVLSEISHGYVQNAFDRVDNINNPWNKDKAKINPKKTPEQIAAQKGRITKQFNNLYGNDNIQYDFEKNNSERYYGDINQPNPVFHPEYSERDRWQTSVKNGGVTINGTRYTVGNKTRVGLKNGESYNDNGWDWHSSRDYSVPSTPVAIDSNGQAKTGDKFTQNQVDALNNVANTYSNNLKYPDSAWNKEREVKRGGKPFKNNLSENKLKQIVAESISSVLNELNYLE